MVKMMDESNAVGVETLVQLDQQGEQIRRIDEWVNEIIWKWQTSNLGESFRNMDKMGKDMGEAESNLHNMEKCCGLCVMPWNKVSTSHYPIVCFTAISLNSSTVCVSTPKITQKSRFSGEKSSQTADFFRRWRKQKCECEWKIQESGITTCDVTGWRSPRRIHTESDQRR